MDTAIIYEEVIAAIGGTKKNAAVGADKINNALMRNLNEESIRELTEFVNKHWVAETVLFECKHSEVTITPKLGTKLPTENLRPISLTSCLGKLYQRVVTKRLQDYMEENDISRHKTCYYKSNKRYYRTCQSMANAS